MAEDVKAQMERLQNAVKEGGRRLQELLLRAEQLNGAIQAARSESNTISESRIELIERRKVIAQKIQAHETSRGGRHTRNRFAAGLSSNS